MTAILTAAYVPHVSAAESLLRIVAGALLAGIIGLEREAHDQPAGFRTQMLLGLGAAVFALAGVRVAGTDPTRIAAQVVSGIGFLGAGAIVRHGIEIKGITTAASIWVSASVGLACGLGDFFAATVATAIALIALVGLRRIERSFFPRARADIVSIDVAELASLPDVIARSSVVLGSVEVVRVTAPTPPLHRVTLHARLGPDADLGALAQRLRAIEGVRGVELRP